MDNNFKNSNAVLRSMLVIMVGLGALLILQFAIPKAQAENTARQLPGNRYIDSSHSGKDAVSAAPIGRNDGLGFPDSDAQDKGTIGGGTDNYAGRQATVGGGSGNIAGGLRTTISGGSQNHAKGDGSVIGGGMGNRAYGDHAVIGGGLANEATNSYATIAGGNGNRATERHSTVVGGTRNLAAGFGSITGGGLYNTAQATYSTVCGGIYNQANGLESIIGGGAGNNAGGEASAISGGMNNKTTDDFCIVAGGRSNLAGDNSSALNDSAYATVAGGLDNRASGAYAMVAGGRLNQADGDYSFAAGRRAKVSKPHIGSILFSDAQDYDFKSVTANEFAVRATGGFRLSTAIDRDGNPIAGSRLISGGGSWETLSDRQVVKNISRINPKIILDRLAGLALYTWNYDTQDPAIRHLGPLSQDFYRTFELGSDDRYISTVDADGVALGAAQGLYQLVQEQNSKIIRQQQQIRNMQAIINSQISQIEKILEIINGLDDIFKKK